MDMTTNMVILLTGANGSIGSQLRIILANKYKVIALDRNSKNLYDLNNLKEIDSKKVTIVHFGAMTPANSENCKQDFFHNLDQFDSLIESILRRFDVVDVINASSMSVYDTSNENIITEESKKTKKCNYGISKLAIEKSILKLSESGKIRNYASLRLPGVLSRNSAQASGNFLSRTISAISKNKDLNIYNKDILFNNMTTSLDIAQLIQILINANDYKYQSLNIGSKSNRRLGEILEYAKLKLNSTSKIHDKGTNPTFTIDISRLKEIGFVPSDPLEGIDYYISVNELPR